MSQRPCLSYAALDDFIASSLVQKIQIMSAKPCITEQLLSKIELRLTVKLLCYSCNLTYRFCTAQSALIVSILAMLQARFAWLLAAARTPFQPTSVPLQVHMQPTTAQQELVRSQLGWKPWSGTLHPGPASRAASCGPALAGVSLELQVQVGGLGVSVVGDGEELLYGRITGIQIRAVTGVARQTLELAIQQVQVFPFICPGSHFVSNAKSGKDGLLPSAALLSTRFFDGSCSAALLQDMVSAGRLPAPLTVPAYLPVPCQATVLCLLRWTIHCRMQLTQSRSHLQTLSPAMEWWPQLWQQLPPLLSLSLQPCVCVGPCGAPGLAMCCVLSGWRCRLRRSCWRLSRHMPCS